VEVQPEQRGGDGGHAADVLPDEGADQPLHPGAALGVEPHPELPARAGHAAGRDDHHCHGHGTPPAAASRPAGRHCHAA